MKKREYVFKESQLESGRSKVNGPKGWKWTVFKMEGHEKVNGPSRVNGLD